MSNIPNYPRVLIIYHSRINKADQHGVSIRGWFRDWPKENLAQIYSGGEVGEEVFCKYNFKLGPKERRFGKYFFKIKDSSIGKSSYLIKLDKDKSLEKLSFWTLLKSNTSKFLISTGLWELIFKPILSTPLEDFIQQFDPQIIYCQGYSLTFTWLPVMVHKRFQIPICFQTGDDWPSDLYLNSPLSFTIRPKVNQAVKSLLTLSKVRLVNGKSMGRDYYEKYDLSFEPIMMCDNLARFRSAVPKRVVDGDTISVVYSGGLGHERWISIVDLCQAARLLESEGLKIMVTTFATSIPHEAVNVLKDLSNLQMLPGPSHEELPSYLKGADILYLPETLDTAMARMIHLSISTKAHLYMMSEKPILLYASPVTGIMNYAIEEGWGCLVQEQGSDKLAQAVLKLITDKEYRKQLIDKGIEVVQKNHDELKVKSKFLAILNGI